MLLLSDQLLDQLFEVVKNEAESLGVDISFSILDDKGYPLFFRRIGNVPLISTDLVPKKAYTSVMLKAPTDVVAGLAKEGGPLHGINTTNPNYAIVSGGFPLMKDGQLIGAIGIGGGSWDQDIQIGKAVVSAFENYSN